MLSVWSKTFRQGRTLERSLSSVELVKFDNISVQNEPILSYKNGSSERNELQKELQRTASVTEEVPIIIGGKEFKEGNPHYQVMPHNHSKQIAKFYYASDKTIQQAIKTSVEAQKKWDRTPLSERITIWEKAADLISGPYRQKLNAATMLGQSKTLIQAEIDSAAELIDFFRFNVYFLKDSTKYQPISEQPNVTTNSLRFRGIDGFFAAISPFNFSAIGGNLAYTPALMGNSVIWKPSDTAVLSNWRIFNVMREAGLPDGVVNFVPADGPVFGKTITSSPDLAGINFTGSVPTFNWIWQAVGANINKYRNYPRLIGECGGKNYHFIHPSADVVTVIAASIRSAFEYSGQKCSACSRMYVPKSLCEPILTGMVKAAADLEIGDVSNFKTFAGAVIDDKAFTRITNYIKHAQNSSSCEIVAGGTYDNSVGYFVRPTIVMTSDPHDKLMTEEIFGPVLTVYVYDDAKLDETLDLLGSSTKFALTGAIFAKDKNFIQRALQELKTTAGNFYINDKSTGAVVGQQPFGGGRMSGTNDKAGGPNYVMRFTSPQAIKETFVPLPDIEYPYMKN